MARIVAVTRRLARDGHPVPEEGPPADWPRGGVALEARLDTRAGSPLWRRVRLTAGLALAWVILRMGRRIGGFDPLRYKRMVSANADFRKLDDGLKMTIDIDPATRAALIAELDAAQAAGLLRYGLSEQAEAMMTCFVPSALSDDHVHFIDGASGGYTAAARQMKSG
jgi:hypothetical protein